MRSTHWRCLTALCISLVACGGLFAVEFSVKPEQVLPLGDEMDVSPGPGVMAVHGSTLAIKAPGKVIVCKYGHDGWQIDHVLENDGIEAAAGNVSVWGGGWGSAVAVSLENGAMIGDEVVSLNGVARWPPVAVGESGDRPRVAVGNDYFDRSSQEWSRAGDFAITGLDSVVHTSSGFYCIAGSSVYHPVPYAAPWHIGYVTPHGSVLDAAGAKRFYCSVRLKVHRISNSDQPLIGGKSVGASGRVSFHGDVVAWVKNEKARFSLRWRNFSRFWGVDHVCQTDGESAVAVVTDGQRVFAVAGTNLYVFDLTDAMDHWDNYPGNCYPPSAPSITIERAGDQYTNTMPTWKLERPGMPGPHTFRIHVYYGQGRVTTTPFVDEADSFTLPKQIHDQHGDGSYHIEVSVKLGDYLFSPWVSNSSQAVTVDTVAPESPFDLAPEYTNAMQPMWTWSAHEEGDAPEYFEVKLSGEGRIWHAHEVDVKRWAVSQDLDEGGYTLQVRTRDKAGNDSSWATKSVHVDRTAPRSPAGLTGNGPITDTTTMPGWHWSDSSNTTWVCRWSKNGGGNSEVSVSSNEFTLVRPDGDGDGTYQLSVAAKDRAGNQSEWCSPVGVGVNRPVKPPTVSGPTPTNSLRPTWEWSSGGYGSGWYRWQVAVHDAAEPLIESQGSVTAFTPDDDLDPGLYVITVWERNQDGQGQEWSEPTSHLIRIDVEPPQAPAVAGDALADSPYARWTWTPGGGGGAGKYQWSYTEDFSEVIGFGAVVAYEPAEHLHDGLHTLYVRERDAAGNWSDSGSADIQVDSPPLPPLVDPAQLVTNDTTPSWTVTSGGNGADVFRWRLGSEGDYNKLTGNTIELAPLEDGEYTLYVSERDDSDQWSADGTAVLTVDTVPPEPPTLLRFGSSHTNDHQALSWRWSWGLGGSYDLEYLLTYPDSSIREGGLEGNSGTLVAVKPDQGDWQDGTYTMRVGAKDAAGNSAWAELAIVLDRVKPSQPDVNAASPYKVAQWHVRGSEESKYFYYNVDNSDPSYLQSIELENGEGDIVLPSLTEGQHTLRVQQEDLAGNVSDFAECSMMVDKTAPVLHAGLVGSQVTNHKRPAVWWECDDNDLASIRFEIGSGSAVEVEEPSAKGEFVPESDLSHGHHSLRVIAVDMAYNETAVEVDVDVDLEGPSPVVFKSGPILTNAATAEWEWTPAESDDGIEEYRLRLDSSAEWQVVKNRTYGHAVDENVQVELTLEVQQRDQAGNWSESSIKTIVVDRIPPVKPVVTGESPTANPTPSWTWQVEDGVVLSRWWSPSIQQGVPATGNEMAYTPAEGLATGSYTLFVQVRDAAGNWSEPASYVIAVDRDPARPPVVTGPAITMDTTPGWSWTSGGGGIGTYRWRQCDGDDWQIGTVTGFEATKDLEDGDHSLMVQERDDVGNWSASGSFTIQVVTDFVDFEPRCVAIEGGEFTQGDQHGIGGPEEGPTRSVTLTRGYAVGMTEVSHAAYAVMLNWALDPNRDGNGDDAHIQVVDDGARVLNLGGEVHVLVDLDDDDCALDWDGSAFRTSGEPGSYPSATPMREVSWYGALFYCWALNAAHGHSQPIKLSSWSVDHAVTGYRLPTEAEWAFAARAGREGDRFNWTLRELPDEQNRPIVGWEESHAVLGADAAAQVGSSARNDYGLHDMAGNLWEWCSDRYAADAFEGGAVTDPLVSGGGTDRVVRGGSWANTNVLLRNAVRGGADPSAGQRHIGFRVVIPDVEED